MPNPKTPGENRYTFKPYDHPPLTSVPHFTPHPHPSQHKTARHIFLSHAIIHHLIPSYAAMNLKTRSFPTQLIFSNMFLHVSDESLVGVGGFQGAAILVIVRRVLIHSPQDTILFNTASIPTAPMNATTAPCPAHSLPPSTVCRP